MFATANSEPVSTWERSTAFGSVVINGIHFDITAPPFTRMAWRFTQTDLAVGQIARVHGPRHARLERSTADHVDRRRPARGPLRPDRHDAGSFVALGQTVTVDSAKSFKRDLAGLSALAVGDVVEVSGLVAADGHICGTRNRTRESGTTNFQVIGNRGGSRRTAHTFKINALTVD